MEVILILSVAFVFITLIGHGIWVLLAWIARGGVPRIPAEHMPFDATLFDDRAATARYVSHLRAQGMIDEELHARLLNVMAAHARAASSRNPVTASQPPETAPPVAPRAAPPPPIATHPISEVATHPDAQTAAPDQSARNQPLEPPPPPSRPLSEVLASFMAEKNIRWGELIGGILILCCSAALVISLWSQIDAIPVLKFLIFTVVTAGLFGAGLFVHHRWRLPTTGHALLILSTLLVPLNLLAFAAFSGPVVSLGWTSAIEASAVLLFGWLTLLAARILVPDAPWRFACGVVGLSALSLAIRTTTPPPDSLLLFATSAALVTMYMALVLTALPRLPRGQPLSESKTGQIFLQLGVLSYAAVIPLGLLVRQTGAAVQAAQFLAPLVCLFAVAPLYAGLSMRRHLAPHIPAAARVVALSVALVGAGIMMLGIGLAWPMPQRLLPALLINAAAMAVLCRVIRHPLFHAAYVTWAACAWVLGIHLAGGLAWAARDVVIVATALLSARTGQALVVPVFACLLLAARFDRRLRRTLSVCYLALAGALFVPSFILITWYGFGVAGDARHVAWTYACYAVAAFVVSARVRARWSTWLGAILAQFAIIQTIVFISPWPGPLWPVALLAGASLATLAVFVLRRRYDSAAVVDACSIPLVHFATLMSLVAAADLVREWSLLALPALGCVTAWIAALWLMLSVATRWNWLFFAAQLALVAATVLLTQHKLTTFDWYRASPQPALEPWLWQIHLTVAGVICLGWAILRSRIVRSPRASSREPTKSAADARKPSLTAVVGDLLNSPRVSADHVIAVLVLIGLVVLSAWSVAPSVVMQNGGQAPPILLAGQAHAAGLGSWLLAAVCVAILIGAMDAAPVSVILGGFAVAECCVALAATRWPMPNGAESALRWYSSTMFLLTSTLAWTRTYWRTRFPRIASAAFTMGVLHRGLTYAIAFMFLAIPPIALTAALLSNTADRSAISLTAMSDFGVRSSFYGPVVLLIIALWGSGIRESWPGMAGIAAVLACAAATGVESCIVFRAGAIPSIEFMLWLVQLNVIVIFAFSLLCQQVRGTKHDAGLVFPIWLRWVGRVTLEVTVVLAAVAIGVAAPRLPSAIGAVGTVWGMFAAFVVHLDFVVHEPFPWKVRIARRMAHWTAIAGVLVSCALVPLDTGNWLCFHTLLAVLVLVGWTRFGAGIRSVRQLMGPGWDDAFHAAVLQSKSHTAEIDFNLACPHCGYNLRGLWSDHRCPECGSDVTAAVQAAAGRLNKEGAAERASVRSRTVVAVLAWATLTSLLCARALLGDPQQPWWTVGGFLALSALSMGLGGWTPRRALAYVGGLAACAATTSWWLVDRGWNSPSGSLTALVSVNVVALAVAGAAWLFIERRLIAPQASTVSAGRWPEFHHAAALFAVLVLVSLVVQQLSAAFIAGIWTPWGILSWLAWTSSTLLLVGCCLAPGFRGAPACLYTLGLVVVGQTAASLGTGPSELCFVLAAGLACCVIVSAASLRVLSRHHAETLRYFGIPAWLPPTNSILALLTLLLCGYVSVASSVLIQRALVGAAPALCAVAILILPHDRSRVGRLTGALLLLTAGGALCAWSTLQPSVTALLQRAMTSVAVGSGVMIAATIATRRGVARADWRAAIARWVAICAGAVGIALIYACSFEVSALAAHGGFRLPGSTSAAFGGALVVLLSCAFWAAAQASADPLRLRDASREAYVYVAVILTGILGVHIRVSMPWLFTGVIQQYWTILVVGLAMALAAIGDTCERRGHGIVGRPLVRTGIILPFLTLPDLFFGAARVHYSIALFAGGALYGVLAGLRRSAPLAVLTALFCTGSLWFFLSKASGLGITQHPQLWFIPPALAVLVASHMGRPNLSEMQRRTIHYACLLAVYLSSTADIMLLGVAHAPWLPLVLAGLSIGGILAGIAARLRSFLILGTGFLLLAMLTMVWHAATNLGWTWVWYVAGIVLGASIIAVFALLEKKRQEMTAWFHGLKSWQE